MNIKSALLGITYMQNSFNLENVFVLRLFKKAKNQTDCSRLEQSSVIKFLAAEKFKQWEILLRMCHVYEEVYFTLKKKQKKNLFIDGLNWNDSSWSWNTDSPLKKMFKAQWSVKKSEAVNRT